MKSRWKCIIELAKTQKIYFNMMLMCHCYMCCYFVLDINEDCLDSYMFECEGLLQRRSIWKQNFSIDSWRKALSKFLHTIFLCLVEHIWELNSSTINPGSSSWTLWMRRVPFIFDDTTSWSYLLQHFLYLNLMIICLFNSWIFLKEWAILTHFCNSSVQQTVVT